MMLRPFEFPLAYQLALWSSLNGIGPACSGSLKPRSAWRKLSNESSCEILAKAIGNPWVSVSDNDSIGRKSNGLDVRSEVEAVFLMSVSASQRGSRRPPDPRNPDCWCEFSASDQHTIALYLCRLLRECTSRSLIDPDGSLINGRGNLLLIAIEKTQDVASITRLALRPLRGLDDTYDPAKESLKPLDWDNAVALVERTYTAQQGSTQNAAVIQDGEAAPGIPKVDRLISRLAEVVGIDESVVERVLALEEIARLHGEYPGHPSRWPGLSELKTK